MLTKLRLSLTSLAALVLIGAAMPQTPTCAQLQARFLRLDEERGIARKNGDLSDVAKITLVMAAIRAQQASQGCGS